jgi:hypothetical protein
MIASTTVGAPPVRARAPLWLSWRCANVALGTVLLGGSVAFIVILSVCVGEYVRRGMTTADQANSLPAVLDDSAHSFCRGSPWSTTVGLLVFMVVCVCPISVCYIVSAWKSSANGRTADATLVRR